MAYLFLILAFVFNSMASLLLKSAASLGVVGTPLSPIAFIEGNWKLLLGLFLFASNVILYFLAIRTLPLSVAYPVMAVMTFLIVNISAVYFFDERIVPMQVVGYIGIIVGIVLVVSFATRV